MTLALALAPVPRAGDRARGRADRRAPGSWRTFTPSGQKIRIHGDLHLGQVLRAEGDWLIFDFEGEPARSFAQRREKHSPLRDVAGMLRSFAYAAATRAAARASAAGDRVGPARARPSSRATAPPPRGAVPPRGRRAFDGHARRLELEKMLYELRYELQNRPDWVRIPVQALMAMEAPQVKKPMDRRRSTRSSSRSIELRHPEPHRVLGIHPEGDGVVVRAFRPDADRHHVARRSSAGASP